jgi:Tol biopolymer transport system component
MSDASPVSLSEISIPLRPVEAVTIVRELAHRVAQGSIPGVPSAQVVRVCPSGAITVEGPVAADGHELARAAHLLESLLPSFAAPVRVPGALRLIIARAVGTLDLPPYASLHEFAEALDRFAAPDPEECMRTLLDRCGESTGSRRQLRGEAVTAIAATGSDDGRAITISDIRRARRATGLTLADISAQIRIPAPLLCELEWGYLANWPASPAVRRHIVSYARAAGLDDQLVVRTVWPLFEESLQARGSMLGSRALAPPRVVVDAVPVDDEVEDTIVTDVENPAGLATIIDRDDFAATAVVHPAIVAEHARRRTGLVAAFVIPALIAIGLAPAAWDHFSRIESNDAGGGGATAGAGGASEVGHPPTPAAAVPASDVSRAVVNSAPVDTPQRAVSDGPALSPAFASIGSAMFYRSDADAGSGPVRAAGDGRGSVLRITSVIEPRASNFHARPSPDGSLIAFDSDRDGERGVYVSGVDGRNVRRVSGDGFAAIPSWSPDGGTLAFVRGEADQPDVWNLWTLELATGEMRRLTSYHDGQTWGGSWFPDGRRLAYTHDDRLLVIDRAGGIEKVYSSPVKGASMRTPAVSPDANRVVFQVQRKGTWLLDLQAGTMRKVMADPSAEAYTWSPDGRRVAYYSRDDEKWGVWVMGTATP